MRRIELAAGGPHFIGCWNLDDDGLCADIVAVFDKQLDKSAPQGDGSASEGAPKQRELIVHPRQLEEAGFEALNLYIDRLFACFKDYVEQFPALATALPKADIGSFSIHKAMPGDQSPERDGGRSSLLDCYRVLAWTSFLNTVEDGGSTHFDHQEVAVPAEQGKTLIWPAEWTHSRRDDPVKSGERYTVSGWMHFPHEAR